MSEHEADEERSSGQDSENFWNVTVRANAGLPL